MKKSALSIIPLGGLGEIGKNMTAIKYQDQILVIDCGLAFPEEDMMGIDLVLPDYAYLVENREKLLAVVLTHGHEDHIGGLPYFLRQINVPIYGSRLALGLVERKLKEHGMDRQAALNSVNPRDIIEIGSFKVEFIRVSHSIPDAMALAIHTPVGTLVHTGDFKIDHTPIDGDVLDLHRFASLGEQGVLVLLSDSTNVEKEGYTFSERLVGNSFDEYFREASDRIIIATFASNIHRLQQAIITAHKYGRQVAVAGRSMVNVITVASELGYLNIPEGTLISLDEVDKLPSNKVLVLTTGSQGEPMSALTRMAYGEHRQFGVLPGDTVIISAMPIPGNEKTVSRIINQLFKLGANVIYEGDSEVHVSGHPSREELKLMLNLIRPQYFIPVHGEYRMLMKHAQLAQELGIPQENIFVGEIGQVFELTKEKGRISGRVPAGRVLVDGLGVGDVGNIVLRDRREMAQEGILIVVITLDKETHQVLAGPDIISRGFIYVRESEALIEETKVKVTSALQRCTHQGKCGWTYIKAAIKSELSKFLFERTRRRPMILPIIMEIEKK
ncbi:ribonuclease J [Desulforamulus aquiferis]|uniref:Ribonuclease J n=1 Tax=Desulforamulus aquiferis TaxID=1397668 RepID=A0AAW7ZD66_9FIRM|nr:ribonuclease J [Desulforamulus aquiferis]MDO7787628.1 ribonuclease J [Desulforamulus aquiferis]